MASRLPKFERSNSALSAAYGRGSPSDVLYQVDFTASASGKHIGPTKKHVRFHFGFANLAPGLSGVECRGKEFTVELIWSLATGKRIVLLDDHVIHSSLVKPTSHVSLVDSKFQLLFPLVPPRNQNPAGNGSAVTRQKGRHHEADVVGQGQGHLCKITAHPFPPLGLDGISDPRRQFDLTVDGQSYFDFLKLYQLQGSSDYAFSSLQNSSGNRRLMSPIIEAPRSAPAQLPASSIAKLPDPVAAPSFDSTLTGNFGAEIAGKIDEIDLMSFDVPAIVGSLDDDESSVWGNSYMPFAVPPRSDRSTATAFAAAPTWDEYRQAYYSQSTQSLSAMGASVAPLPQQYPPQQTLQNQFPANKRNPVDLSSFDPMSSNKPPQYSNLNQPALQQQQYGQFYPKQGYPQPNGNHHTPNQHGYPQPNGSNFPPQQQRYQQPNSNHYPPQQQHYY